MLRQLTSMGRMKFTSAVSTTKKLLPSRAAWGRLLQQFPFRLNGVRASSAVHTDSVKGIILTVAILFFGLYAFMFRDVIRYLPELMRGEVVINGDELVPFFNPHSQLIDQAKGEFNELTHGYEFRVRYSIMTTWMRYYKVLPFALLLAIPSVAFISFIALSLFWCNVLPDVSKQAVFRAVAPPTLFIFLVFTYAKVTHFYTLIIGFSIYLMAGLQLIYGLLFATRRSYRLIAGACVFTVLNPAVHYIILFALTLSLMVAGIFIIEIILYLAGGNFWRKLHPASLWRLFWDNRRRLPKTFLGKGIGAFFLMGVITLVPYGLFVKFFVLSGVSNLSETVPVNYYFIEDASVPFWHVMSFDLAGIIDKLISGDYLAKQPRATNIVYTLILFLPLLKPDLRRRLFSIQPLRKFFIVGYGLLLFAFWATLGYSGPDYLPTFHRTIAFISNVANGLQSSVGDIIVKLMGTIVQVLRFPHRFQLILFLMACIILPVPTLYIENAYRSWIQASALARYKQWLYPLFYVWFFVPMLLNWQYQQTFFSGNFYGFLAPYPVGPLREVKEFLLKLPKGKTIVLPPTETAKRIVDIDGEEHKFIDKFHIYFLDMPSYYYGLTGDSRNKHEFFLMLRALYYEQDWWVNIARDNYIKYIIINKELKANIAGGAEYLRNLEETIIPQMDRLDQYLQKIFENESFAVYEFIDPPNEERTPLFINMDWNSFIQIQNQHLDLSKTYDLRYSMVADDLADYETLTVITDDEQKTAIDLYLKAHPDQFFQPSSIIFPFNKNVVPSSHYLSPMFRLFQFFSDSKWNRLKMITPGLYGSITGSFIGLPGKTTFRIDAKFPEAGAYRLLLSGSSTVNELMVKSKGLGFDRPLSLTAADTSVVFFEQEKVFSPDRKAYDVSGYSVEELELMIPTEIVAINYQFRYIDLGTVEAPAGTQTIYFDKLDNNPLLVEGVLVIPNDVYENLQLPDNVTVLEPGSELEGATHPR